MILATRQNDRHTHTHVRHPKESSSTVAAQPRQHCYGSAWGYYMLLDLEISGDGGGHE